MRKQENRKISVVDVNHRGPLKDQTNVLKNPKDTKASLNAKDNVFHKHCTTGNNKNCRYEKEEAKEVAEKSHVLKMKTQMTCNNVQMEVKESQKGIISNRVLRKRNPLREHPNCSNNKTESKCKPENNSSVNGNRKHIIDSPRHLKLVLKRLSPINPPKSVDFMPKDTEATSSPRRFLEKLDPINGSPEFQGFTEREKTNHTLTPKNLKVFLNRIEIHRSGIVPSGHHAAINDKNIPRKNARLVISLVDISPSSTESPTRSPNRSLNEVCSPKTLRIDIPKSRKLERMLSVDKAYTHVNRSPEFLGFDNAQIIPPKITQHLNNSLDKLSEYLTTLNEQTNQKKERLNEDAEKEKGTENSCNPNGNKNLLVNKENQKRLKLNGDKPVKKSERVRYLITEINHAPSSDQNNVNVIVEPAVNECKENQTVLENQYLLNLRKLPSKNYCEESTIENSEETTRVPLHKKKVPVYLQKTSESKKARQIEDEYEFTDISPRRNFKKNNQKRSSGFFDKNTCQVLKKLEKDEQKKKRGPRKKNKKVVKNDSKPKSYGKIVDKIVSNVLEKVKLKNQLSVTINNTEKNQKEILASKDCNNVITVEAIVHVKPKLVSEQGEMNREISHSLLDVTGAQQSLCIVRPEKQNNSLEICCSKQVSQNCYDNISSQNETSDTQVTPGENSQINRDYDQPMERSILYNDRTLIGNDMENFFGFEQAQDVPVPYCSSPINPKINLISNVVVNGGCGQPVIDSPVTFGARRPNANSTMLGNNLRFDVTHRRTSGSPWRLDLRNIRQNPHFVSIKNNALPRIDQEMVLDHTLVDNFESHCTKTPQLEENKRSPIQQSILNYVECDNDIEKENVNNHRSSLFDYEAFNSPVKNGMNRSERVQAVKRRILEDSVQNHGVEQQQKYDDDVTYFGFNNDSPITKHDEINGRKIDEASKPCRFDPHTLKKYIHKKKIRKMKNAAVSVQDLPSVSILSVTNDDENSQADNLEMHLFEEPEDLFDDKPIEIPLRRTKRTRADLVEDLDDTSRKHKKHKKSQFEIEQEMWMKSFNKELEEIDKMDLETD